MIYSIFMGKSMRIRRCIATVKKSRFTAVLLQRGKSTMTPSQGTS